MKKIIKVTANTPKQWQTAEGDQALLHDKQLELFSSVEQKNQLKQEINHWKLFIDGAARNNPGPAGAGIYLLKNNEVFGKYGFFLGKKTNNQAEYLALLLGLLIIKKNVGPYDRIRIVSDSQLLVRQIKGEYRIKNVELKPLYTAALTLMGSMHVEIHHVFRIDNADADSMANYGVDHRINVPQDLKDELKHHGIII